MGLEILQSISQSWGRVVPRDLLLTLSSCSKPHSEPRAKSLAWTWVQARFKWGQRGQGGYKEPHLLVLVTSPPTQSCQGRLRDASTDRALLLNTTTCLSRRTDRISPGSVGKCPRLFRNKEPPHTPGTRTRGGSGAMGEMLCCSAISRSAWLGGQHPFRTPRCIGYRVDHVSNSCSSGVEKSGVCWGFTREWIISEKPTSSHCFS